MTNSSISSRFFLTLRGKIMLAFVTLAAVAGGAGMYVVHGVEFAGRLVEHAYSRPLMAIDHARFAQAGFSALELAIERFDRDPDIAAASSARIDALEGTVLADLMLAGDHAASATTSAAARTAVQALADWRTMRDAPSSAGQQAALREQTARVIESLGLLGDLTADDGSHDEEQSVAAIAHYRALCGLIAILVLLIGVLVATILARQVVTPVALASRAAGRIAAGDFDTDIRAHGDDELGRLLAAMIVMRDNMRRAMEREIAARRSAQSQLADAIEGAQSGVALLGMDGRVLIANSRIREFFPGRRNAFARGERVPVEIDDALAHPTGETRLADGRWLRLTDSPSKEGGKVLIASDISFLKEREAALREARDEAEAANRAKTDFLTNMSHELRTPLSAVIGFSEMIVKETFGPVGQPRYREFADDILHAGRHLMDVITDILDIAKAQSGTIELQKRTVRPEAVLSAAVRIVHEKARDANIRLATQIGLHLPTIEADTVRLRQVLLNLLSNALKFTAPGGTINAEVSRHPLGVALRISDTGSGMALKDIPRALQPFGRVDNSLARRHGGTGLGLPLTRMLVELHGGWLEIESTVNVGTTVTVILPVSDGEVSPYPFAVIAAAPAESPARPPVLVNRRASSRVAATVSAVAKRVQA